MHDNASARRDRSSRPWRLRHLLPAAALVALVAGATATAASEASTRQLITGRQIKDNSITAQDLRSASLTGSDVDDRAIRGVNVDPALLVGPAGPRGALGAPGDRGDQGQKGATGLDAPDGIGDTLYQASQGTTSTCGGGCEIESAAVCPDGFVTGGGATTTDPDLSYLISSRPSDDRRGWQVRFHVTTSDVRVFAIAVCTHVPAVN